MNINGYTLYRADRCVQRGGGSCIYISESIGKIFKITNIDVAVNKMDTLALHLQKRDFSITLCCVYRPPSVTSLDEDLLLMEKLAGLSTSYENLIIVGDFNYPHISWPIISIPDNNNSSTHFMNFVMNSNLEQLIEEHTRFRGNDQPATLDLIFTNADQLVTKPVTSSPIGLSDHAVINFQVQFFHNMSNNNTSAYMNYTYTNFTAVKNDLSGVDWNDRLLPSRDTDDMWIKFQNVVTNTINQNSRQKKVRINNKKPWIDANIMSLVKHKKNLWKKFKQSKTTPDFDIHRRFSNSVRSAIREAKSNYEESIAQSNNPKKLYKYIRSTLTSKVSIPLLRKKNGEICNNNLESAEVLADFFKQVYTKEPDHNMPNLDTPRTIASLNWVDLSKEKIQECLKNLKSHIAPGPDGMSSDLLKQCSNELATPLLIIFQSSAINHDLPKLWKTATITAIFKNGDKLDPSNYRPISLTSIPSKIMESLIADKIFEHLSAEKVIPREQHGFVRGRSTVTNLLHCVNSWTLSLDNKQPTDVIYLDFAKAFDRVPTKRLLYKLDHVGVRGGVLLWIENFLLDRTFSVKVGQSQSSTYSVLSGVPQGSVLGPLLFNVYVSDLPSKITSCKSFFADDCKIYANPLISYNQLQTDLNLITVWCEEWLLPLNCNKCAVLNIGKNNPHNYYYINNMQLTNVDTHNDLGVIINSTLSWSEHITSICKRANTILYLLKKTFSSVSYGTFIKLYKTYVRPHLEYAGAVWCPDLVSDRNKLENLQRYATRIPFGRVRPSYEERLEMANLSLFSERRLRGDLISTYRILNNLNSANLSSIFSLNQDERLRGHPFKLLRENFKTRSREYFLSNRVFHTWNSLPAEVVKATSINAFKNSYDSLN